MGAEVLYVKNMMGTCCTAKMTEQKKVNKTLRIEPLKCIDFLSKQPALGKYSYKMSD